MGCLIAYMAWNTRRHVIATIYANENVCDAKIEFLVTDALTFQLNNGRIRVFAPKIVNGEA